MSEETENRSPLQQVEELWKQWYDTSSKVWSEALTGVSTTYGDPYGLYRSWLQTLEGSQHSDTTTDDASPDPNPAELWKQWIETTSQAWRQSFSTHTDPLGLTTRWLEMMEKTRRDLLHEAIVPTDPFTFFKQWYESSHEAWSKAIEEIIGNDRFVESASRYIESYTTFYKNFRRLNEDYFSHLQLVTRSDLTRVAELIVALENKVDTLQDASDDLQGRSAHFATLAALQPLADHVQTLEHHIGSVEQKSGELLKTLRKLDMLQELSQRLDTVEGTLGELPSSLGKLDTLSKVDARLGAIEKKLEKVPAASTQDDATTHLTQRLDSVEQKLDALLTLLSQNGAHPSPAEATTNRAARASNTRTRKTPKTSKKVSDETPSSTNTEE